MKRGTGIRPCCCYHFISIANKSINESVIDTRCKKTKQMTRWQGVKGPWQPRLGAFSPTSALFFSPRCCGRWAIITGRQSMCWSGALYLQLPLSWPGPHYRAKTEQIKSRGLVGIWSNLFSPPGWAWSAAGGEKGQRPEAFCQGRPLPLSKAPEKNSDFWLSCGFNRRASTQFRGNQGDCFRLWWTASCVTEMTIMKEKVPLCFSLGLWSYQSPCGLSAHS